MQSVIPPGDPARTIIAGKSQGWRGLAINFSAADMDGLVRAIVATLITSVHLSVSEDSSKPGMTFPTMTTAWMPNPAELAALNAGGSVVIQQLGSPPINPMSVYVGEVPSDG